MLSVSARAPVALPVEPRCGAPWRGIVSAAATDGVLMNFAEEAFGSVRCDVANSAAEICQATGEFGVFQKRVCSQKNERSEEN